MTTSDSSAFGYQEDLEEPSGVQRPLPRGPGPYKFSQDELRVLKECNAESFFKRSLPMGTALGLGTYYAIQQGRLKPNPRFGPFPKVTLAIVMGYFIGKLSYQQKCAEKLMALPGSYIGQLLRDKRDGKISNDGTSITKNQMFGANPNDIYSDDSRPGNSLDMDTDRPIFSPDDTYRPSDDGVKPTSQIDGDITGPPRVYTYEELRRKNRSQYQDSRQDPYRSDEGPPISRAPAPSPAPAQEPEPTRPVRPPKKNKYGDEME